MSLLAELDHSPLQQSQTRTTTRRLFSSIAEGMPPASYSREEYLSQWAETILPQEALAKARARQPRRLSIDRWFGNIPSKPSLIVKVKYCSTNCCVRRHCVVVVSYSKYLKGIRVCGPDMYETRLPRYADQLTAELCAAIDDFVSSCPT